MVARAGSVAAESLRPFCIQDHSLEAAALGRPALEGAREVLVICEDARQGLGRPFHGPRRRFSCYRRVQTEFPEDARQLAAGVVSERLVRRDDDLRVVREGGAESI